MSLNTLRNTHNWNLPEVCPVCGESLILSENHRQLSCSNQYCPSRSSGTIAKWVEKMKIMELGLTTIEKIQSHGYFLTISAIYKEINDKTVNKVLSAELGKNWDNIKEQIKTHTEATIAQFISGYNITGIGEKQVQKVLDSHHIMFIEDLFKNLNGFVNYDLIPTRFTCDGIGEILSRKLHDGLEANKKDMLETVKYIKIIEPTQSVGKLTGKSFCFTGAMDYKRSVLQDYVIRAGGTNFDSVKKGLTYLVMADPNSTSTKAVKARSLGITIISPVEFLSMVGMN